MVTKFGMSLRVKGTQLNPVRISQNLGLALKFVRAPDRSIIAQPKADTIAGYCSFEGYRIAPGSDLGTHFESVAEHLREHREVLVGLREQGCEVELFVELYFSPPTCFSLSERVVKALSQAQVDCGFDLYQEQDEGKAYVQTSVDPSAQSQVPVGTVWFGGGVDEIRVALEIAQSDLSSEEVTDLLQCSPCAERSGYWIYELRSAEEPDFDQLVQELFAWLTRNTDDWMTLAEKCDAALLCEFDMKRYNRGLEVSFETMLELAKRHLSLRFWAIPE